MFLTCEHNKWLLYNSNKFSTSSSPSLSQNYLPQNREVGMMWLDIPGHMLQPGQTSSSLQRPLNNTTKTIYLFCRLNGIKQNTLKKVFFPVNPCPGCDSSVMTFYLKFPKWRQQTSSVSFQVLSLLAEAKLDSEPVAL